MDEPLEELKRQRELIRQHLEWLDRQIAANDSTPTTASERPILSDDSLAKPTATKSPAPRKTAPTSTVESGSTYHQDPVLQEALRAERASREKRFLSGISDVDKAKYGCLILFLFGIGVFLFFLFGLPAFLD